MTVKKVLSASGSFPVKIWTEDLDQKAETQLQNIAKLPFIHKHISVMPDVHLGIGATIGSVIPTKKAIIPAAVGIDIGCGMLALQTNLQAQDLPASLTALRKDIERNVPVGVGASVSDKWKPSIYRDKSYFLWSRFEPGLSKFEDHKVNKEACLSHLEKRLKPVLEKHPALFTKKQKQGRWVYQIGTLGSGNHFIEVCLDERDKIWIMLHSGSRGIGNCIGRYFIELAKEDMRKWHINLPDQNLGYFPTGTDHFNDYWEAVKWAQDYASVNRVEMAYNILACLKSICPQVEISNHDSSLAINCHHNYVALENHYGENVYVTRKGAIRARKDDFGIIPGSMGTCSFIVKGKGNKEAFQSCSHGAGRAMSRTQARQRFSEDDLKRSMTGIEYKHRPGIVDEIDQAYKPIKDVMENQTDLVEVVHTLKQILSVKGD